MFNISKSNELHFMYLKIYYYSGKHLRSQSWPWKESKDLQDWTPTNQDLCYDKDVTYNLLRFILGKVTYLLNGKVIKVSICILEVVWKITRKVREKTCFNWEFDYSIPLMCFKKQWYCNSRQIPYFVNYSKHQLLTPKQGAEGGGTYAP